jgi:hypothetical protein
MYVCMCVSVRRYFFACMHIVPMGEHSLCILHTIRHLHARIHTYIHTHTHVFHTETETGGRKYTAHTYKYRIEHTHTHTYTHTCIHREKEIEGKIMQHYCLQTHTYIHAYTHTYNNREIEIEGKKYATLLPADTPVILAGYEVVRTCMQHVCFCAYMRYILILNGSKMSECIYLNKYVCVCVCACVCLTLLPADTPVILAGYEVLRTCMQHVCFCAYMRYIRI